MSILRKDPVSSGWVIMSEERALRLPEIAPVELLDKEHDETCPLCEGNERMTPPEIVALRDNGSSPNSPGWSMRVVPNKFAVLRIEGDLNRTGDGIYDLMGGVGAHEVIVETTHHNARISDYCQAKMEALIRTYRERVIDLYRDGRFKYAQIFRNYGQPAGAMLDHPHSQIIALPIIPRWVREELGNAREYYDYKERCLFCDIINQEIKDRQRLVYENDSFVVIEPFASKFAFETWLMPKTHNHDFQFLADSDIAPLADALRRALRAIQVALENPPFNFLIHSAPRVVKRPTAERISLDFHWHIEIIPHITRMAGFEWATGCYINPTLPEHAAQYLRSVLQEQAMSAAGIVG